MWRDPDAGRLIGASVTPGRDVLHVTKNPGGATCGRATQLVRTARQPAGVRVSERRA